MPLPFGVTAVFTGTNGIFGNITNIEILYDEGGSDLVITIADSSSSAIVVTLTVGMTAGVPNIDWDAIATLFNADTNAAKYAMMEGTPGDFSVVTGGFLSRGWAGAGLGQYYSSSTRRHDYVSSGNILITTGLFVA